jgi:hypothetical protein
VVMCVTDLWAAIRAAHHALDSAARRVSSPETVLMARSNPAPSNANSSRLQRVGELRDRARPGTLPRAARRMCLAVLGLAAVFPAAATSAAPPRDDSLTRLIDCAGVRLILGHRRWFAEGLRSRPRLGSIRTPSPHSKLDEITMKGAVLQAKRPRRSGAGVEPTQPWVTRPHRF